MLTCVKSIRNAGGQSPPYQVSTSPPAKCPSRSGANSPKCPRRLPPMPFKRAAERGHGVVPDTGGDRFERSAILADRRRDACGGSGSISSEGYARSWKPANAPIHNMPLSNAFSRATSPEVACMQTFISSVCIPTRERWSQRNFSGEFDRSITATTHFNWGCRIDCQGCRSPIFTMTSTGNPVFCAIVSASSRPSRLSAMRSFSSYAPSAFPFTCPSTYVDSYALA